MTRLVQNVTNDNFADLGSKFIEIAGKGFVIARHKSHKGHSRFDPTPAQWKAWIAYFRGKGINRRFMEQRDYWTVPAEWPHLFDAEATVARDYAAGEREGVLQPQPKKPPEAQPPNRETQDVQKSV